MVVGREFKPEDEASLRETLKRCSASTLEAACQFRRTGNVEHLPAIIFGVIERYVESNLRPKLKEASADLRLAEDLGIDSLTMMEIVMQVEEALQITINNQELRALRTLGEVRQFMENKLADLPTAAPEAAKMAS
ncbi:MAG: Beta-hydroxyacyl-(acyl-carrier-protein) dehydratase FabA/FabZ [Verrucomicrobia bacterium]|nr:Beta-hydroxyacyl-(acyl-carrier-protein) dehydratase FabA/FabZ [Verrucomicrobiota bacterium]